MEPTATTRERIDHVEEVRAVDARLAPVTASQETVPMADAMEDFWRRDTLTFSIPGHQGGVGTAPDVAGFVGADAVRMDLPLSHGVDRRDRSWKVLETAQQLFAEAVGADSATFVTNGSSMSIWIALLAVAYKVFGVGRNMLAAEPVPATL